VNESILKVVSCSSCLHRFSWWVSTLTTIFFLCRLFFRNHFDASFLQKWTYLVSQNTKTIMKFVPSYFVIIVIKSIMASSQHSLGMENGSSRLGFLIIPLLYSSYIPTINFHSFPKFWEKILHNVFWID